MNGTRSSTKVWWVVLFDTTAPACPSTALTVAMHNPTHLGGDVPLHHSAAAREKRTMGGGTKA